MAHETQAGDGGWEDGRLATLERHSRLSAGLFLIGVLLAVAIGYLEDEPTVPPLVMMLVGIGWFVRTRYRIRAHNKRLARGTG